MSKKYSCICMAKSKWFERKIEQFCIYSCFELCKFVHIFRLFWSQLLWARMLVAAKCAARSHISIFWIFSHFGRQFVWNTLRTNNLNMPHDLSGSNPIDTTNAAQFISNCLKFRPFFLLGCYAHSQFFFLLISVCQWAHKHWMSG